MVKKILESKYSDFRSAVIVNILPVADACPSVVQSWFGLSSTQGNCELGAGHDGMTIITITTNDTRHDIHMHWMLCTWSMSLFLLVPVLPCACGTCTLAVPVCNIAKATPSKLTTSDLNGTMRVSRGVSSEIPLP